MESRNYERHKPDLLSHILTYLPFRRARGLSILPSAINHTTRPVCWSGGQYVSPRQTTLVYVIVEYLNLEGHLLIQTIVIMASQNCYEGEGNYDNSIQDR